MKLRESLTHCYAKIKEMRDQGIKMKEISEAIDFSPSVLSAIYVTVLPVYFETLKSMKPEDALKYALSQVNNVSKKKIEEFVQRVQALGHKPIERQESNVSSLFSLLKDEVSASKLQLSKFEGIYMSYSISSSTAALKKEPFYFKVSKKGNKMHVGRKSAYQTICEGVGIVNLNQTFYILLDEAEFGDIGMVVAFLKIPYFEKPKILQGVYLSLDYNRNPIARRIVLKKISDAYSKENFDDMEAELITHDNLSTQEKLYYDYTCTQADYLKMYSIPNPKLDERDLAQEKAFLKRIEETEGNLS